MKTLGIIGGIAPESTVEYYRTIIRLHRERTGKYPSIVINSIDLTKMLALADGHLDELTRFLLEEIGRLHRAGADLGMFASNTPHLVFDAVSAASPLPLVSIVEAAGDAAAGLRRVALFGTRFTMQADFYPSVFARRGIEVVLPTPAEQELIHTRYMSELVQAQFLDTTRADLLAIVDRMTRDENIEAVILGGTELPLLLRDETRNGVRLLDTTGIHAERVVSALLA